VRRHGNLGREGGDEVPPPLSPGAQEFAARKLNLIKDLLAEGAARYDTALLRELQDVMDKAGAYSLTPDDPRLRGLEGSISTVMGLPLDELAALLAELYPQDTGDA
jgi:hypothetical protein